MKQKKNKNIFLILATIATGAWLLFRNDKETRQTKKINEMSGAEKAEYIYNYIAKNNPLNTNTEQIPAAVLCSIETKTELKEFEKYLKDNYNININNLISNNFSLAMQKIIAEDWKQKNLGS